MLRILLAATHLLALGIGWGAIHARARALRQVSVAPDALGRVFAADSWWGAAFGLWVVTGLWRALAGTEKVSSYYWSNHVFYAKMGLLAIILALEIAPMVTLIRWRSAHAKKTLGATNELAPMANRFAVVSHVQTALLIAMVFAAVMMARGYGARL